MHPPSDALVAPPAAWRDQPANRPSDEELMERIVAGDQGAFQQLYSRHRLFLLNVISRLIADSLDVDEVLQDVFMTVWNRASLFERAKGEPLGWIICVSRRRAVDHLRRTKGYRERRAEWPEGTGEHPGDERLSSCQFTRDPGHGADDLWDHLRFLIKSLPVQQQDVLQLTYVENLSQREIVTRTGIPLGTIKTRLELARRKLSRKAQHLQGELH